MFYLLRTVQISYFRKTNEKDLLFFFSISIFPSFYKQKHMLKYPIRFRQLPRAEHIFSCQSGQCFIIQSELWRFPKELAPVPAPVHGDGPPQLDVPRPPHGRHTVQQSL